MLIRVRPALAIFFVLLWPGAAAAADTPTLTLKAPPATSYGHRIEFDGRLTPAVSGARIRLYRGTDWIATAAARGDGSYRIPVAVASPGPFHVGWLGFVSPEVTIRIVPRLDASFVGAPVVGSKLTFHARLTPARAGSLRVRVYRDGRPSFDQLFAGAVRVSIGTTRFAKLRIALDSVPREGYATVTKTLDTQLLPPTLSYGSTSPALPTLLRQLGALHYAIPSVSDSFTGDVLESVYAFEKVQGLDRTGVVDARFWTRLANPRIPKPRYPNPADHIEIDKNHQVLYIVRGGQISMIIPVSTAGIAGYYTPEGKFAIYRKVVGYDPSPLGVLLNPMYFVGGYAIHGNPSVPPYPASHGCVRVPNYVIYRIFDTEPYGETVYVYS
jgi:hypothetical protein